MNIWRVMSSKKRVETLAFIIEREFVGVEETAKLLGRSKGFVSQFFNLLEEEGILKKERRKYKVLLDSPNVRAIKILLNIAKITEALEKHRKGWMTSVGIYGSFAKGENTKDSDLDVWIVVDEYPEEREIARVGREISDEIGKHAHLLILTKKRIERLRKEDPIFYCELLNSFVVWGERLGF
jgi:predicted nucleotidyltransferase